MSFSVADRPPFSGGFSGGMEETEEWALVSWTEDVIEPTTQDDSFIPFHDSTDHVDAAGSGDDFNGIAEEFKGYRRRWRMRSADAIGQHSNLQPGAIDLKPSTCSEVNSELFGSDSLHVVPNASDTTEHPSSSGTQSKNAARHVIDAQWRREALNASVKRARLDLPKYPWECRPFDNIFGSVDCRLDAFLGGKSKQFAPTSIGIDEILHENSFPHDSPPQEPIALGPLPKPCIARKARVQKPDDDVRRVALQRLQNLLMNDPGATVLGGIISSLISSGADQYAVDQTVSDAFRSKASSTLQKRAGSLARFSLIMEGMGCNPLRFTEEDLYNCLCAMRDKQVGPTAAQHLIEALHFLHGIARFKTFNLDEVISARCKGAARDQFLRKHPLQQKSPLPAHLVKNLEVLITKLNTVEACILGQLLFCVHACARWSDSLRICRLWFEESGGEILVHADAQGSKTSVTAENQRRLLPYVALGMGVAEMSWSVCWMKARCSEGLDESEFFLPSFSERSGIWVEAPMSASEATCWLRHFIDGVESDENLGAFGTHSCKPTVLTWIGRCSQVWFSQAERRLIGHHLTPNAKSVETYSRESYTAVFGKILMMYRSIRRGEFDPDCSALERIINAADVDASGHAMTGLQVGTDDNEVPLCDSDSSVASEHDFPIDDDMHVGDVSMGNPLQAIPNSSLVVHKISKVMHVINEDDTFACGRNSSRNYRCLTDLQLPATAFEPCQQCVKTLSSRDP